MVEQSYENSRTGQQLDSHAVVPLQSLNFDRTCSKYTCNIIYAMTRLEKRKWERAEKNQKEERQIRNPRKTAFES